MTTPTTATVIGAGIAGLLAGWVLSRRMDHVTVIERDALPDQPAYRSGVPHSRHVHILLKRGLDVLQGMFPGFKEELIAAGAVQANATTDVFLVFPKGALPKFPSDLDFISCSRELLEFTLRKHILHKAKNLTLITNAKVQSLTFTRDSAPELVYEVDGEIHKITDTLVVDASGRNSNTVKWLTANGFPAPREDSISPYLGYSSQLFKDVAMPPGSGTCIVFAKSPSHPTGGVVIPIEHNQYLATFYGFSRHYPPQDAAEFIRFAEGFQHPAVANALRGATAISDLKVFRKDQNSYRLFGKGGESGWPRHFLVIGEAVCSFNPVYGQGMTMAAEAALVLQQALASAGDDAWACRTQRKMTDAYKPAWEISCQEDLRWPETEGKQASLAVRFAHRYTDKVNTVACRDPETARAYLSVLHMVTPVHSLLTPSFLWRILRQS